MTHLERVIADVQAASRVRDLIASAVATKLDVPVDRLVFGGGRVFDAQEPDTGLTFREAVGVAEAKHGTLGAVGSYTPPRSPGRPVSAAGWSAVG